MVWYDDFAKTYPLDDPFHLILRTITVDSRDLKEFICRVEAFIEFLVDDNPNPISCAAIHNDALVSRMNGCSSCNAGRWTFRIDEIDLTAILCLNKILESIPDIEVVTESTVQDNCR